MSAITPVTVPQTYTPPAPPATPVRTAGDASDQTNGQAPAPTNSNGRFVDLSA